MQESFEVSSQIRGITRSETQSGAFRDRLSQAAVIAGDYRFPASLRLDCSHTKHLQFTCRHDEDIAGIVYAWHIDVVHGRQIDASHALNPVNQRSGSVRPNCSQGPATTSAAARFSML
jgi:hypothetical protein